MGDILRAIAEEEREREAVLLALRARVARLEEALTPSTDTKAAYMGEFSMRFTEVDDDGVEHLRSMAVPWTTIKDIMKAIARRALEEK